MAQPQVASRRQRPADCPLIRLSFSGALQGGGRERLIAFGPRRPLVLLHDGRQRMRRSLVAMVMWPESNEAAYSVNLRSAFARFGHSGGHLVRLNAAWSGGMNQMRIEQCRPAVKGHHHQPRWERTRVSPGVRAGKFQQTSAQCLPSDTVPVSGYLMNRRVTIRTGAESVETCALAPMSSILRY